MDQWQEARDATRAAGLTGPYALALIDVTDEFHKALSNESRYEIPFIDMAHAVQEKAYSEAMNELLEARVRFILSDSSSGPGTTD